jgi:hypothetical protein
MLVLALVLLAALWELYKLVIPAVGDARRSRPARRGRGDVAAPGAGLLQEREHHHRRQPQGQDQTVKIAQQTENQDGDTVLTRAPEGLAYTDDYAQKALDALKASGDTDVTGTDFKPTTVKLNPGGA